MRWNFRQRKIQKRGSRTPTYRNPLFTKKSWQQYIIDRFGFFTWLLILFIISTAYILFYSPLFNISSVQITNTQNIDAQTIENNYIKWQMQQKKWLIFKQRNIFLFDSDWLRQNLTDKFSFESLSIDKKLPKTIRVEIIEKKPVFIWLSGNSYFFIDNSGKITSKIEDSATTENQLIVSDESNEEIEIGQEILLTDKVQFINNLVTAVENIKTLSIITYTVPNNKSTQINANTEAGYTIYFDSSKELDSQVSKLQRIISEGAIAEQSPQEYIDLRIGDRVYMK